MMGKHNLATRPQYETPSVCGAKINSPGYGNTGIRTAAITEISEYDVTNFTTVERE